MARSYVHSSRPLRSLAEMLIRVRAIENTLKRPSSVNPRNSDPEWFAMGTRWAFLVTNQTNVWPFIRPHLPRPKAHTSFVLLGDKGQSHPWGRTEEVMPPTKRSQTIWTSMAWPILPNARPATPPRPLCRSAMDDVSTTSLCPGEMQLRTKWVGINRVWAAFLTWDSSKERRNFVPHQRAMFNIKCIRASIFGSLKDPEYYNSVIHYAWINPLAPSSFLRLWVGSVRISVERTNQGKDVSKSRHSSKRVVMIIFNLINIDHLSDDGDWKAWKDDLHSHTRWIVRRAIRIPDAQLIS